MTKDQPFVHSERKNHASSVDQELKSPLQLSTWSPDTTE